MSKIDQISPEQLASCRKQLERRWKSRKIDEALLEHAWQVVYEIATFLYDELGATKVAVFGSLTEPIGFTKSSDIDIAVWGISDDTHTNAYDKVLDMNTGFKIDLINFDMMKGFFRERVQQQAIPIKKEEHPTIWKTIYQHKQRNVFPIKETEIYEMNRKKLTQRINDELVKIEDTLARIQRGLEKLKVVHVDVAEFIENTIATDLANIYSGIERIFERIANEVDGSLPRGSRWHKNLLEQMTRQRPERPPVISDNTALQLEKLLNFRHKVNNIYGKELVYENTLVHAETIDELFEKISHDLKTFTDSLTHSKEDIKE